MNSYFFRLGKGSPKQPMSEKHLLPSCLQVDHFLELTFLFPPRKALSGNKRMPDCPFADVCGPRVVIGSAAGISVFVDTCNFSVVVGTCFVVVSGFLVVAGIILVVVISVVVVGLICVVEGGVAEIF